MFVIRAVDKVVLLHRAQVHPGQRAQGCDAFPGQLCQGQFAV
jgi:hypothetical protein